MGEGRSGMEGYPMGERRKVSGTWGGAEVFLQVLSSVSAPRSCDLLVRLIIVISLS